MLESLACHCVEKLVIGGGAQHCLSERHPIPSVGVASLTDPNGSYMWIQNLPVIEIGRVRSPATQLLFATVIQPGERARQVFPAVRAP